MKTFLANQGVYNVCMALSDGLIRVSIGNACMCGHSGQEAVAMTTRLLSMAIGVKADFHGVTLEKALVVI